MFGEAYNASQGRSRSQRLFIILYRFIAVAIVVQP